MSNMEVWNKVCRPPTEALKQIKGGRLSGMTDISPQWRYKVLTEVFGPCGSGWSFEIVNLWKEDHESEVLAFAHINLIIGEGKIPGVGGSKLVAMESKGAHVSDEGYKMAITDALSTAAKMIGVGADIYMGLFDGTKYKKGPITPTTGVFESLTSEQQKKVAEIAKITSEYLYQDNYDEAVAYLTESDMDNDEKVACWSKIIFGPKQKATLNAKLKEAKGQ